MVDGGVLLYAAGCGALGALVAVAQRHPRRRVGLIPVGLSTAALGLAVAAVAGQGHFLTVGLIGLGAGLAVVPTVIALLTPTCYQGPSKAFLLTLVALTAVAAWTIFADGLPPACPILFAAAAAVYAWVLLFPQAIELGLEVILWPVYRIRAHGPGAGRIPRHGPLLIVANHAAYLDPLWVGKVVPRHLTPMMTSLFYDKPVIRWLMVHAVGTIRVEESAVRKEAPELRQAVEVLKKGGCVLVFPEASLRRTEEILLRPFGQGVWHILKEVPETPVVVCWIEGGWGSYTSYKDGPPLTKKPMDRWRRIDLAVAEARPLPAEALADHRTTRQYLFRAVAACRGYLGLPVPDDGGRVNAAMGRG